MYRDIECGEIPCREMSSVAFEMKVELENIPNRDIN